MKAIKLAATLGFVVLSVAACERRDNADTQRSAQSAPGNPQGPQTSPNPNIDDPAYRTGQNLENTADRASDKMERAADRAANNLERTDGGHFGHGESRGAALAAGSPGSREWARDRMAKVRCDHYTTCGNVGKDKKYDTLDSCVVRERASLDKDWSLDDCAKIDSIRLDTCISDVKAKKCDNFWTSFPDSCASSKVCIERDNK